MEQTPESRRASFATGHGPDREPFHTVQRGAGRGGYRPRSVLDTLTSSGVGYSDADRSRLLINGEMLRSPNGIAQATYQKSTWLDSPYRPLA